MFAIRTRRVSPSERRRLHRMKRQLANAVNRGHARIILLSSGAVSTRDIAERTGYSQQWVRQIIHRFNSGGLEAIEWYPWMQARGRPRKFLADVVEQIICIALSPPQQVIGMTQWSLSKLRAYVVEQKILDYVSLEWLRTLLHRYGIRWRRTKTWKESKDPDFWPKFQRIRRLYRHRPIGGRRICIDEFGPLNLQPRHGTCLAGQGKRVERLRATYHRFGGVRHFFAAYDVETDRLVGVFAKSKKRVEYLRFLKWLRRRYRRQEVLHIVVDNYTTHLRCDVLAWAKRHNVRFYFTPTNASWLNRIECELTSLKKFTLANSDYATHEEMQHAIELYLSWRNRTREIAITSWKSYRRHRRVA